MALCYKGTECSGKIVDFLHIRDGAMISPEATIELSNSATIEGSNANLGQAVARNGQDLPGK